jgi:sodium/potassium/calcium exchanger 6
MALTTSPLPLIIPTVSRDISRESSTPGSPLGFRDSREPDELTTSSRKPRFAWWPSFLLPDPQVLYLTLFPTVRKFREKSWLQRILAVLAVPAVFCFTITLPVVDTEAEEEEETFKFPRSPSLSIHPEDSPLMTAYVDAETETVIIARAWNRWLTGVQCLVAPVFLTYLFFCMQLYLWC